MEEHTLSSMMTGEIAYTLPWGMWVDKERQCWLHPDYGASPNPHGTCTMRVMLRKDGYHVWVPPGETYKPSSTAGYVSPADTKYLPVTELHR